MRPVALLDLFDLLEPMLRAQDALSQMPADTVASLVASCIAVTGGAVTTASDSREQQESLDSLRAAQKSKGRKNFGFELAGLSMRSLARGGGGDGKGKDGGSSGGGGDGGGEGEDDEHRIPLRTLAIVLSVFVCGALVQAGWVRQPPFLQ